MSIDDALAAESVIGGHAPCTEIRRTIRALIWISTLLAPALPTDLWAQQIGLSRDSLVGQPIARSSIDSLVGVALETSPVVRAASARLDAARHGVGPAAAWPDPRLVAGIVNQPLRRARSAPGTPMATGPDPMTMRMVGVSQTIPYPAKVRLERTIGEREVDAATAALEVARRQVERDAKVAYYEIAFLDHALALVGDHRAVIEALVRTTEARYAVGQSSQQEVLDARIDATRLAQSASSLLEQRRAAVARLDAVLSRPSDAPLPPAELPAAVERAALGDSTRETRFASAALGARVSDSPLPPLGDLQELAIRNDPELRAHEAMIAAQTARLELARTSVMPDFDVSVQYGQRGGGLPDMLTATVSVPLPVQKRTRQDEEVASASATLAALHAEHEVKVDALRSRIAGLVSDLERERTELALYRTAILPQARAALTTSSAAYEVGKVELATVLDRQSSLFGYQTDYYRALSDFASNLAELERIVGKEMIQ